ncbi:FecR domain-containing protein [Chitinophaga cymbidii]|uniref:Anti-sigma factor n=1 Tax=Chitinophaga cymbidii TaxID=1096750 RepID=A0A512RST2_9BACT|nr:FecR domain-containing protein [Chitinophaga cymbidii]GEP98749.1 anti-sigma factor [Chitinophaga cymbidii]
MKHTNRMWYLMGRELSGSMTPAEKQELEALLALEPELWYSYELIQAVNNMDDVTNEFVDEIKSLLDTSPEPEKLNTLLQHKLELVPEPPARRVSRKPLLRYAAVLAGIILTGWAGIYLFRQMTGHHTSATAMNEIVAPKGAKTQITLADGTTIWLNAGSRLTYPKNFSMENREVHLTGEAYFKVVHNDHHSFTVHTPEAVIRDLGTTFNVKAYEGSETTETTLIEGAVEVSLKKDPSRKIMIAPHEKVTLHSKRARTELFEVSKIVPFSQTKDIVETAWVDNKLIFRNEKFADLAHMMERKYNVSIVIADEAVKDYELTGIFHNESIAEALKLLQVIAPFKYEINNEQITIHQTE